MSNSVLSGRLREARERFQLSQRELAARCGMGEKQVWRYENGESEPSADHLARLARQLSVSADYLLGLVDSPGKHFTGDELTPVQHKLLALMRDKQVISILEAIETLVDLAAEIENDRLMVEEERHYSELAAEASRGDE